MQEGNTPAALVSYLLSDAGVTLFFYQMTMIETCRQAALWIMGRDVKPSTFFELELVTREKNIPTVFYNLQVSPPSSLLAKGLSVVDYFEGWELQ